MQNKLIPVIFIALFFFAHTATGQKLIDSPFSRFNLGTLQPEGSFRSLGMGSVGIAMRDNNSIYYTNPSSYSSLDTISFVFDFGLDYGRNYLSNGTSKFSSTDMNFHHLMIGFPLSKGWGIAAGIVPLTSGYYKITTTVTSTDPEYNPSIGEYIIDHSGDGGITKLFIGTGIQIGKHLSFGVNLNYLSGQITRNNQFVFTDFNNVFHSSGIEKFELGGINFDYGLQYSTSFKNNYFLNIGASLTSANNLSSKYNQLSLRYNAYSITDTVSYTADNYAKTFIPATVRVGLSFGKKNKFTTGIDFLTTKWSASKIPGSVGYAADSRELRIGAEYIPDKFSNYSYLRRIEYRIGGHIGDNYLIINGEQLKEYGASIGLGIPLRTLSKVNLFIDFTRKTGISLHNEDYLSMGISLNLYDFWFLKMKYD
jgi:hypothetical protein